MNEPWWKKAVIYQIYPQSFKDSNGDGIGDLPGITEKLDYIEDLGVNTIWICPIYQSPMVDNGYDISDYYRINPMFGRDEDVDKLINEADKRGIKILLDLVINHCSDEHVWFKKALQEPDSEEAGYFYFRKTENDLPPNNWRSNFGGPAWSQTGDGRWYLHTFSSRQPDLNWENPKLRAKLYEMINWWLDKGIGGFRVDAITFIKKDTMFASGVTPDGGLYPIENFENYPGIELFLNELKQNTFQKYDCVTVAEAPGVKPELFADYAGPDGYFSMIFDFNWDHMKGVEDKSDASSVAGWRDRIFKSQQHVQENGWGAVFLENHDQARCPDKFLEKQDQGYASITCLGTVYFLLRGTPFIYQGQELGMTNVLRGSIEEFKDVSALNSWKEGLALGKSEDDMLSELNRYGRDNARTPFQWNQEEHAGFTTGTPWMPVHENYQQINVEQASYDSESILAYYKKLIRLRRTSKWSDLLAFGTFEPVLTEHPNLIAYRRSYEGKSLIILNNFSRDSLKLSIPFQSCVLSNQLEVLSTDDELILQSYQSVVLLEQERP